MAARQSWAILPARLSATRSPSTTPSMQARPAVQTVTKYQPALA
jgi:hypothetical protein